MCCWWPGCCRNINHAVTRTPPHVAVCWVTADPYSKDQQSRATYITMRHLHHHVPLRSKYGTHYGAECYPQNSRSRHATSTEPTIPHCQNMWPVISRDPITNQEVGIYHRAYASYNRSLILQHVYWQSEVGIHQLPCLILDELRTLCISTDRMKSAKKKKKKIINK